MRGYIYAYVDPEYTDKGNNVVDVKLRVFEGEQFRLGRLEFEGNTTTKDKVLRREIFLEEGSDHGHGDLQAEPLQARPARLLQGHRQPRLQGQPRLEDRRHHRQGHRGREERHPVRRRLLRGRRLLRAGAVRDAQLPRRGRELLASAISADARTNFFSISYADPWFMDTPNSLGVSLYNRETILPASFGYEQRGKGGTIAYGYRLRRFDSVSLLYGYERVAQRLPDRRRCRIRTATSRCR